MFILLENTVRPLLKGSVEAPGFGSKGDMVTDEEREGVSGSWAKGSTCESVSLPLSLETSSWDFDSWG